MIKIIFVVIMIITSVMTYPLTSHENTPGFSDL